MRDTNALPPLLRHHLPLETDGNVVDQLVVRLELIPGPDCGLSPLSAGIELPEALKTFRLPVGGRLRLCFALFRALPPLGGFRGFILYII
jgi:hypothetical protein